MSDFHSLKVHQIDELTPSSVKIHFEIPRDLKETFSFKSGQYVTLKTIIDGAPVRRAYSISSAPSEDFITVGIKRVSGGLFSTYATKELNVGDTLEVMPPQGKFIWDANGSAQHIAAFAAGSGITPILSIAKNVLESNENSTLLLVFGNKTKDEVMYADELAQLQGKYPERFFYEQAFSRTSVPGAQFGRIDKSVVNHFIKNTYANKNFENYYICGPEDMIKAVYTSLYEGGIPKDRIHYELFSSKVAEEQPDSMPKGQSEVTVVLDEVQYSFTMEQKDNLLDKMLKEKIDAPYSCQGGVCSSCIAKVVEGSATMKKNEILTPSEVEEGLILTCQAHPTTAKIKIDFDDV